MTVQHDTGAAPTERAGEQSKSAQVGEAARSEASNVASTAAAGGREVAAEASAQARVVASEARQQVERLVSQGRGEVRQQAEQRSSQAAGQLQTLSEQFSALAQGRPEDAGPLVGLLNDVQNQVRGLASRLERGGPQGLLDDLTGFARRRPGAFLAGVAAAGFVVGRVARAGAANQQDDSESPTVVEPVRAGGPSEAGALPDGPPIARATVAPESPVLLPPVDPDPRTAP